VETQDAPINEAKSIDVQIAKINDQIEKSKITNPIKGTVLAKYAEPKSPLWKPLYKIADISEMTLRVYVSETQLSKKKVQQVVKIDTENEMKSIRNSF
jgi:HlyD family secretion protein